MAIAAVWDFPDGTPQQYEEVFKIGGAALHEQPKRLSHVCYRTPTGIRVIDVWLQGKDRNLGARVATGCSRPESQQ